jgi:RNA polymerase sigma-70 factor (ECF subfamily)
MLKRSEMERNMSKTFHEMLIETLPKLRPYAVMLAQERARAEDLLQETAVRALAAQHQFQMGTNFSAWLYRILRNEFIDTVRKSRRTGVSIDDLPEALMSYTPRQDDQLLVRELAQALGQLPRAQREALTLVCGSGLSYEEAAGIIGCSMGTIKSRISRARQQMEAIASGEGRAATKRQSDGHRSHKSGRAVSSVKRVAGSKRSAQSAAVTRQM